MSEWRQETIKHNFEIKGLPEETRIWVFGAMDMEESGTTKFLVHERVDNEGYSLRSPGVMESAMRSVADRIGIDVDEVEWYAFGKDKQMYQLDVKEESRLVPHPEWQRLANSDLSRREDLKEAKKAYPDEEKDVLSVRWNPVEFDEARELVEAYAMNEASVESDVTPERQHFFDLTQEYFQQVQQEPAMEFQFEEPDLQPEASQSHEL